jgi:hypothetical protein
MQGRIAQAEETVGAEATLTKAEVTYGAEAVDVAEATTGTAATRVATVNTTANMYPTLGLHRTLRALERTRGGSDSAIMGPRPKRLTTTQSQEQMPLQHRVSKIMPLITIIH